MPCLYVIFSLLLLFQSRDYPLWFLILISLFDNTVVTRENLHLKKFKTDNKEYVKQERKLIFDEFVKWAMTYM